MCYLYFRYLIKHRCVVVYLIVSKSKFNILGIYMMKNKSTSNDTEVMRPEDKEHQGN